MQLQFHYVMLVLVLGTAPFCLITFSALVVKEVSLNAVVVVLKYHVVIIMMLELNVQVHNNIKAILYKEKEV